MAYLFAACLLVIVSLPAHAYLDAGSGSYMLQMSLAGVMAVSFTLKTYWHRIREGVAGLRSHADRAASRRR
jgi:hypothetical protein